MCVRVRWIEDEQRICLLASSDISARLYLFPYPLQITQEDVQIGADESRQTYTHTHSTMITLHEPAGYDAHIVALKAETEEVV